MAPEESEILCRVAEQTAQRGYEVAAEDRSEDYELN